MVNGDSPIGCRSTAEGWRSNKYQVPGSDGSNLVTWNLPLVTSRPAEAGRQAELAAPAVAHVGVAGEDAGTRDAGGRGMQPGQRVEDPAAGGVRHAREQVPQG